MPREKTSRRLLKTALYCGIAALLLTLPRNAWAQSRVDTPSSTQGVRESGSGVPDAVASLSDELKNTVPSERRDATTVDRSVATLATRDGAPLTERERAMLELIRDLQERVAKLESQSPRQPSGSNATIDSPGSLGLSPSPVSSSPTPAAAVAKVDSRGAADGAVPAGLASAGNGITPRVKSDMIGSVGTEGSSAPQSEEPKTYGRYTPNLGFKLADTPYGDLSISIYTYVRYLNQRGLNESYTDALGNTKSIQNRQDMQIQKLQMKFLGWVISPKLRYFLYSWTSNATQGQGAQVVLAGNVSYEFSKYLSLGGGIRSLPGTRSVEGNFPFWMGVDSRHIADEFFRPSYTSGIWAQGSITNRLQYQAMLANNMSTLGVPATRLDNGFNTFSSSLVWFATGDFAEGFSGQGWGDLEDHQTFSTRFGFHFTRSDENKESQPGSDVFENTQLRVSDGTVIFTPDLFGPGITVTDARDRMTTVDGGFKYRGYTVEGEYFWRWIDNLRGTNTAGLKSLFDHGFQIQGSAMVVPKILQAYAGHSKIFGQYGNPWDVRFGTNYFPFKNHVIRWNTEALYLYKSPVGYSSVPFAIGGKGWVFHSSFEVAF